MGNHTMLDVLWLVTASALVLVMRMGFAMLEAGLVRSKNSINISVKVLTDLGVSLTAFWPLGFGLMFGASAAGFIGTNLFFPKFNDIWLAVFFLFHAMFASTSATIVSGAVGERIRYGAYMVVTLIFSAVIYPVVGHWVWGGTLEGPATGWLGKMGFIDFAGGTVVHATGGWISLAALLVLGPRTGRYNKDGSVNRITGSGQHLAVFGTILLWFGWFGFNGGSTLAMNGDVPAIILKTSLSGASGMMVTLLVGWWLRKFPDVSLVINGALAGLVGATAGCAYISEWAAVVIGATSGLLMLFVEWFLDKRGIDDAVTAIPVHLGAGLWGTLCVGIFGDPALLKTGLDRAQQIGVQALGLGASAIWCFGVAWVSIALLNRIKPIRVTVEQEEMGLNVVEHQASTEIYDLVRTLETQTRTGDMSLRAPVEPFTEVGQIATQYNKVMDSLQANMVARSEYTSILSQVSDGLFLVDSEGRIGDYYSASLETILETQTIARQSLAQVLSPLLKDEIQDNMKEYLGILFNPEIEDRNLIRLNPLSKVDLFIPRGGEMVHKHVQFLFKRILENGQVVRLMVLLRDITQQVTLEQGMESEKKERDSEMNLFYRIIHIEPALLAEFLTSLETRLAAMNGLLEGGQDDPQATLQNMFQHAHALKGEAALFDLAFIVEAAQGFEALVKDLQRKQPLENSDFIPLTFKMGELEQTGRKISALLAKLLSLQSSVKPQVAPGPAPALPAADFLGQLKSLAKRIATDYGKEVSLNTADFREDALPESARQKIRDTLVQFVRNAVVHGVEDPGERERLGKPREGQVRVWTEREDEHILFGVRDDGRGIHVDTVKNLAVSRGSATREQVKNWSATDIIRFLFSPGVSSAGNLTTHGGQGVGLSLVRDHVRSIGGKIAVKWRTGTSMEFVVRLPLPEAERQRLARAEF